VFVNGRDAGRTFKENWLYNLEVFYIYLFREMLIPQHSKNSRRLTPVLVYRNVSLSATAAVSFVQVSMLC
jgi:hypothetical protein